MRSLSLILLNIFLLTATLSCQVTPLPVQPVGKATATIPVATVTVEAPIQTPENTPENWTTPTPGGAEALPLPNAEETLSPVPTPDEEPLIGRSLTQYHLQVKLDYWNHSASIEETVRYVHGSPEPVDQLVLLVDANRYPQAFQLRSIAWESGEPVAGYSMEKDQLSLTLPTPLGLLESAAFKISYDLILPPIQPPSDTTRPVSFGFTARQLNLVDWYPYLPPYQNEKGWVLNKAYAFGEHQVYETADFLIELELVNPPSNLEIAASSRPERSDSLYIYRHTNARNFALSASNMYQVLQQTVGEVEVFAYTFPFDAEAGKAVLNDTVNALALYSELFGPYRHGSLTVVEADFLDGMEYDGLYFLSRGFYSLYDGSPRGYLTAIAVHETAHQWWYGQVGNDQAYEPWLDEAMCTYSERLYYERYFPNLVEWWWYFRVDYYEPTGWIDAAIYDYSGFRPYRDAVYLRGALFLEELREAVGDDAFFSFLKSYAESQGNQIARKADFLSLLAEFTEVDLNPLLQKYFETP